MPDATENRQRQLLPGRATSEGTARYAQRLDSQKPGAYRTALGLTASNVGLGTYLGDATGDREAYQAAVLECLRQGINVVDTAINYRHMASERDVGIALATAFGEGLAARDEVIVSTKGGFLPLDFEAGAENNPRKYLAETFLTPGFCPPDEIVAGCQCIAPAYIADQIDRSRANLGLETLDIYFLHNVEMQLRELAREKVMTRVRRAFEVLAERVAAGHIGHYGVATWEGLRQPADSPHGLRLMELINLAIEVEGHDHHFRAIQLPFNLAMSEAMSIEHDPGRRKGKTVLDLAEDEELFVMTSASLMQGQLTAGLPEALGKLFSGLDTDAQRALQHTRCAPGVTTALAGMKSIDHVRENAGVLRKPALKPDYLRQMYTGG